MILCLVSAGIQRLWHDNSNHIQLQCTCSSEFTESIIAPWMDVSWMDVSSLGFILLAAPKASDVPKTNCFLKTMFLKHVAMNDCV